MKDEKNLRQKKGIQYIDSSKAGVKFRTKSLEARNAEYLDVMKKYDLQQQAPATAVSQTDPGHHHQVQWPSSAPAYKLVLYHDQ